MTRLQKIAQSRGLSLAGLATLLLTFASVAPGAAQTVDEVIARHVEARGGSERWGNVSSLSLSGPFTAFSVPGDFEVHHTADGRFYFARDEGSDRVVTGTDGNDRWQVHPLLGDWPGPLQPADDAVLDQDLDLPNTLFHVAARGYQATFEGSGDLDGVPALVIALERPNGQSETWYLDPDTYLEIGRESQGSDFGQPSQMTTFFDDFREVDGLMIPHYVEKQWYTRNRIYEVESVEIDGSLDAAIFRRPLAKGMERFAALEGDWVVQVEYRQNPAQETMETAERTTTLTSLARGGLLQETYEPPTGGVNVRQLSYDRFREVYRLTQLNSTTTYLDIQEGGFDDQGRLVVSNLETGSGWRMAYRDTQVHERNTLVVEDDRWVIETELSIDQGANWFLGSRETYTRP